MIIQTGILYHQTVQLFIHSKNVVLHSASFKYSLHKFSEMILHCTRVANFENSQFLTNP